AVLLGLMGHEPDTVPVDDIPALLAAIAQHRELTPMGAQALPFAAKADLLFRDTSLPGHPNGMRFTAFGVQAQVLLEAIYYSVGGGFVVSQEVIDDAARQAIVAPTADVLPLPFHSAAELLDHTQRLVIGIAELMRRNERHWRDDDAIDAGLMRLWSAMQACVQRGCTQDGELPGGFRVQRRAPALYAKLSQAGPSSDPLQVMDWVNLYA